MESTQVGYQRPSIVLIVNSFGGSVYDGFGLISAIEMSATNVITVCLGSAMSMGFAIFIAGHTRIAHELSSFMYHEIWSGNFGKLTEQKIALQEMERLQLQYDMYVLGRTKISEDRLREVQNSKDDWYLDAHQAQKYGVVDIVVDKPVYWLGGSGE
jgi:ATP-dependent Clp protease protease subunit